MSVMRGFEAAALILLLNCYLAQAGQAEECGMSTNRDVWQVFLYLGTNARCWLPVKPRGVEGHMLSYNRFF